MTVLPLEGVRVIDWASPMGAYCTRLLADLGADVVLLEPPGGDPLRRFGPHRSGESGPESSLTFGYYHANKRSITLDPTCGDDQATIRKLGRSADVVVVSPSSSDPLWGFDRDAARLSWASPSTIVCSITPFGIVGPYCDRPASHLTSFAQGGQMCRIGEPGTPPRPIPFNLHWHLASVHGAIAVVAALGVRSEVGGQFIDLSAQEIEAFHDLQFEAFDANGLSPDARTAGIGIPPSGNWQCRDGILNIAAHAERHWDAFLSMLDYPEELVDPGLADMAARRQIFDGVIDLINPLLAERSRHDLFRDGQQFGLPTCLVNTPAEFISDQQLEARNFWIDLGRDETGPLRAPGAPVRAEPGLFEARRPAPLRGEHTDEIRTEDRADIEIDPTKPAQTSALDGVRVLSFGAFVAGNTTAQLLAGFGAEVAKVEAPSRPEVLRRAAFNDAPHLATEPSGVTSTPMHASLSRGAKGLGIEMGTLAGQDVFRRLVAKCDIVVENFGAGVMAKWGCSFADLVTLNPRIIMASLSGYGRSGPRSSYLAYASSISCFTGLTTEWVTAHTFTDYVAANHTTLAIMAARKVVAATGRGVYIDTAQTESFAAMAASMYLDPLVNGVPTSQDAQQGSLLTHVFPCAGIDRWAAIEVVQLDHWNQVCDVIRRPDLATEDLSIALEGTRELKIAIEVWAERLSALSVAHILCKVGVPASAVATNEDVYNDSQLRHRHFPQSFDHPDLGRICHPGSPQRLSLTPGRYDRSGARLGSHTREILRDWLGADKAEIDELISTRVVVAASQGGMERTGS